jgi:hypothetical protein
MYTAGNTSQMQHFTNHIRIIAALACVFAALYAIISPAAEAATLVKQPGVLETTGIMETTPFLYQGRQILFESYRGWPGLDPNTMNLQLKDLQTGLVTSTFGQGYSLGCAYVNGNEINAFAAQMTSTDWFHDIYRFASTDGGATWKQSLAIARSGGEHLLNSSVCKDNQGYLMAYESDNPVGFCFKFARSTDLATWTKLDVPAFAGPNSNEYSACPMIRYCGGYYYTIYLHAPVTGHNGYISNIVRSKDLTTWEYSDKNPVLEAASEEGCNNSDVDLFEVAGKTYLFYADGDQQTWSNLRSAVYDGTTQQFFESYFPPATAPEPGTMAILITGVIGLLGRLWKSQRSAVAGEKI